jgi:hypothetical protein
MASTAFKPDVWRHLVAMLCKCRKSTHLQVRAASGRQVRSKYWDIP